MGYNNTIIMLAAPYAYGAVGAAPYGAYGLGFFNQQGQRHGMRPGMQNLNLLDDIKNAASNAGNWIKDHAQQAGHWVDDKLHGKQMQNLNLLDDIQKSIQTGIGAAG